MPKGCVRIQVLGAIGVGDGRSVPFPRDGWVRLKAAPMIQPNHQGIGKGDVIGIWVPEFKAQKLYVKQHILVEICGAAFLVAQKDLLHDLVFQFKRSAS